MPPCAPSVVKRTSSQGQWFIRSLVSSTAGKPALTVRYARPRRAKAVISARNLSSSLVKFTGNKPIVRHRKLGYCARIERIMAGEAIKPTSFRITSDVRLVFLNDASVCTFSSRSCGTLSFSSVVVRAVRCGRFVRTFARTNPSANEG